MFGSITSQEITGPPVWHTPTARVVLHSRLQSALKHWVGGGLSQTSTISGNVFTYDPSSSCSLTTSITETMTNATLMQIGRTIYFSDINEGSVITLYDLAGRVTYQTVLSSDNGSIVISESGCIQLCVIANSKEVLLRKMLQPTAE